MKNKRTKVRKRTKKAIVGRASAKQRKSTARRTTMRRRESNAGQQVTDGQNSHVPTNERPTFAEAVTYPRTDAGNAELFARTQANRLRYDHKRGRWLVWKDKHWWSKDETVIVIPLAKNVARLRREASSTIKDADRRKGEVKWAFQSEGRARLEAMLELAKSEHPLADRGEGWDANPWLLGVANGVVDLRTGQFREGKRSDNLTIHTNIVFDPKAEALRWKQFVNEICDDDMERVEYLQRAVGYSITGDVREQVVFLCYGVGANGKSTFLDVIRFVLGDLSYNLPFSAFELQNRHSIPNEIAALEGKRFVTAVETDESVELNEARLKALTGSDPITARYLYHEFFTFVPTGKFWLAFNHFPEIKDDSDGFWRRIRVVEFRRQFNGQARDPKLTDKLRAEASGILNWAIEGALKWQADGLKTPASVTAASQTYRQESDPLKEFLESRCEIGPNLFTTAASLWQAYVRWKTANDELNGLSRKSFSKRLQSRGFRRFQHGHERTWMWQGVRLLSDRSEEVFTGKSGMDPVAMSAAENSVSAVN